MRIPERDVTYIVLSVYLLTLTSPIHKMDHTNVNLLQLKTFELELDFVQWYAAHRVTWYLRLLALSIILTFSFLAWLVLDIPEVWKKLSKVGTVFPATPLHGVWVLVHSYLRVRFDHSCINFWHINGFPKLGSRTLIMGYPRGSKVVPYEYEFLLVIICTWGRTVHRYRDIAFDMSN